MEGLLFGLAAIGIFSICYLVYYIGVKVIEKEKSTDMDLFWIKTNAKELLKEVRDNRDSNYFHINDILKRLRELEEKDKNLDKGLRNLATIVNKVEQNEKENSNTVDRQIIVVNEFTDRVEKLECQQKEIELDIEFLREADAEVRFKLFSPSKSKRK